MASQNPSSKDEKRCLRSLKSVFQCKNSNSHDDIINWKHFRSPVNSTHNGQRSGTLLYSLICALTNGWVNNWEAGDLRRQRPHYYVIVMSVTVKYFYIESESFFESFASILTLNGYKIFQNIFEIVSVISIDFFDNIAAFLPMYSVFQFHSCSIASTYLKKKCSWHASVHSVQCPYNPLNTTCFPFYSNHTNPSMILYLT